MTGARQQPAEAAEAAGALTTDLPSYARPTRASLGHAVRAPRARASTGYFNAALDAPQHQDSAPQPDAVSHRATSSSKAHASLPGTHKFPSRSKTAATATAASRTGVLSAAAAAGAAAGSKTTVGSSLLSARSTRSSMATAGHVAANRHSSKAGPLSASRSSSRALPDAEAAAEDVAAAASLSAEQGVAAGASAAMLSVAGLSAQPDTAAADQGARDQVATMEPAAAATAPEKASSPTAPQPASATTAAAADDESLPCSAAPAAATPQEAAEPCAGMTPEAVLPGAGSATTDAEGSRKSRTAGRTPQSAAETDALAAQLQVVAEVFGLVVEHSPGFNSLRDMCSLLLVSNTVRQQLLRVQGHVCLELSVQRSASAQEHRETWVQWLGECLTWLPRHAGLVDSLSARTCSNASPADMQLLQSGVALALQLMRNSAAAAAAHWSAAAARVNAPSPIVPRLTSVTVTALHGVLTQPFLQELAFTHTRKLVLEYVSLGPANKYASLLGRLTELQELDCGVLEPHAVLKLPVSLRKLSACFGPRARKASNGSTGSSYYLDSTGSSCYFDMRLLTRLRTLVCKLDPFLPHAECQVIDGAATDAGPRRLEVQLPPQLVCLRSLPPLRLGAVPEALRSVSLSPVNMQLLPDLSGLPGPWALHLQAHTGGVRGSWQEIGDGIEAISTAKGLTRLVVSGFAWGMGDLLWCPALLELPQLRSLALMSVDLPAEDVWGLTKLTQLHSLCLDHVTHGCEDVIDFGMAVRLAKHLTGLTSLQLRSSRIHPNHCKRFAPLAHRLTGLRVLSILGHQWNSDDRNSVALNALWGLKQLKQLTHLAIAPLVCSPGVFGDFLASMPGLSCISDDFYEEDWAQ